MPRWSRFIKPNRVAAATRGPHTVDPHEHSYGRSVRSKGSDGSLEQQNLSTNAVQQFVALLRQELSRPQSTVRSSRRWVGGYPELVAQWDWERNINTHPDHISFGSHQLIWWRCRHGPDHRWSARAQSRVNGRGCPFCAGKRVSVTNSLSVRHPAIAREWHPVRNGEYTPKQFVGGSNWTAWWKCDVGQDHIWQAQINARTSGSKGCPFCAGLRPSITNSLASLYPNVAKEWKHERNRLLTPDQVTAHSNRLVWWACPNDPRHVWRARIQSRTEGRGCPYCSSHRVTFLNSLAYRYSEIAKQWHPTLNVRLSPRDVTSRCSRKVWWKCSEGSDHEWRASIASRTRRQSGCPYCQGRRLSMTNCLATLDPRVACEWHPTLNEPLTPWDVTLNSHRMAWWKCRRDAGHVWRTKVYNRTRGSNCPFCH
jgi:hypothetical protein